MGAMRRSEDRDGDMDVVRQLQLIAPHSPGNKSLTYVPRAAVGNRDSTSGQQKAP